MKRKLILFYTIGSFFVCLLTACIQNQEHAGHSEEDHKLTLTQINHDMELFAVYHPLVKGSSTAFDLYLTDLNTYKPASEAKLTVSVVTGETGVRKVLSSSKTPGIFHTSLKPQQYGAGKLQIDVTYNGRDYKFSADVRVFESTAAITGQQHKVSANEIHLPKQESWNLDFGITVLKSSNLSAVIRAPGRIVAATGDQQSVVATVGGVVSFKSALTEGMAIQSGQTLFTVTGSDITEDNLNTSIEEAKLRLAKAKADYERANALRPDQIISEREYQTAFSTYQEAQLNYRKLSRNFSGNAIVIKTAKQGFLSSLNVNSGDYVTAGQLLATVTSSNQVQLRADISASYASSLSRLTSANFNLNGQVYELKEHNGKLLSYGRSVSGSGLIPVTFSLNSRPEFVPGIPVEVYLLSSSTRPALQIPLSAVMEDEGTYYVFIQKDGEHFERRSITLGQSNGKTIEVTSGLLAGDIVVSKGAYTVKLAATRGLEPGHGHAH